jgi:hypothetical protein
MLFDEASDGAAYLSSLKKSDAPRAAGAAAARAPDLPRTAQTQAAGAFATSKSFVPRPDKRRTPRYKCKGSARLQESGSSVATWATFADISLHGCYIETPAPYSLGTFISLKLEVDGLRVEAAGEVRTSFPGVGMGVFFTRMSEPDRARLRALVKSFPQPNSLPQPSIDMDAARTPSASKPDGSRAITNPHAVLQALVTFFEDRHTMGREEFLTILRKNQ